MSALGRSSAPFAALTAVLLAALALVGCGSPPAAPGPTAVPTSSTAAVDPTLASAQAQPVVGSADELQVQDAFLNEIDNLVAEAADLSVTPCDDMTQVLQANPNLVPSLHGFAAALRRVGSTQASLNSDDVKAGLAEMDTTMSQLDAALSRCGLSQP